MDRALQTFEGLIRRSVAPSVTLFVIAAAMYLALVELSGGSAVKRSESALRFLGVTFAESAAVFTVVAVFLVLGVSYGLTALQQILFDNRLKENFDPGPRWKWLRKLVGLSWFHNFRTSIESERQALTELRDRVLKRLRTEQDLVGHLELKEGSDYLLYEILGGIDPIDTRPFVDSAKAIGITFASMILALLAGLVVCWQSLVWKERALLFLVSIVCYWLGREATLAQYRARALRLYVNFLMMPSERIWRRLRWPEGSSLGTSGAETSERGRK